MLQIDRYAYTNALIGVHPAEKALFSVVTLLVCLSVKSQAAYMAAFLLMTGAALWGARIPAGFYLKLMAVPASFLTVGVLTVLFSYGSSAGEFTWSLSLGSVVIGVRPQNWVIAGNLFMKAIAAVSCLFFLSLTTPAGEIFLLLRRLKVPPLFVEMMELVYRFIFVFMETALSITTSQSSRLGYTRWENAYFSMGQLFSNLLVRACHRSRCLTIALESRCSTGEIRFLERSYRLSGRNVAFIMVAETVLIAIAVLG